MNQVTSKTPSNSQPDDSVVDLTQASPQQVEQSQVEPSQAEAIQHGADASPSSSQDIAERASDPAIDASTSERMVPVSESIRYRKRAQAAEQQLQELRSLLGEAQTTLKETEAALNQAERRRQIDQMLTESQALDLDVARLLTEAAVEMLDEPDVQAAVEDLKRQKPYLFRHSSAHGPAAMPARDRQANHTFVDEAAQQAVETGRRGDLMRYLRLRRSR